MGRLLALLFVFGVLILIFGVASLVDGQVADGSIATVLGAVAVAPMARILWRRRQERRTEPLGPPRPAPALRDDPRLASRCRALGLATMVFSVIPLTGAVALIMVGWAGPGDDATTGARAGILLVTCAVAVVPLLFARAYVRCGLFLRVGDTRRAGAVQVINRVLWIGGGLYVLVSMFDNRFDDRTSLKIAVGALAFLAFGLNTALRSVLRTLE